MTLTAGLKWTIIGGLCALLLLPFVVADGNLFPSFFFPYITGKNFTFRLLVEVLFGLYVILALKDPEYRPKASHVMWAVSLFVAWMALATIFSVDGVKSFWSNFERMDGYINVLHLFLYFLVAGAVLSVSNKWNWFFNTSIALSIWQGLWALSQVLHWFGLSPTSQSGARADTSFGNATYLAVYMLFNIFMTLFMAWRERHNKPLLAFYGVALVLQAVGLYATETRGAILGLVGGLLIAGAYFLFYRLQNRTWLRTQSRISDQFLVPLGTIVAGAALVIVVLGGGLFALRNTALVKSSSTLNRLAAISLTDKTTMSRFLIWEMAFKGAAEKPALGWGQENFSYVFNKYYLPEMYAQEQWFDRAHNEFLDWLIAGGFPAFVLYISLFVLAAWVVVKSELAVPERALLLGLLGGYAFNNLFVFDNLISLVYFFTILAFLHGMSRKPLPRFMSLYKPVGDHALAIVAPVVVVLVGAGVFFLNMPGMARATKLIESIMTVKAVPDGKGGITGAQKDPKENLASFEAALTMGELGKQETVEQLFQFTINVAPQSISPDTKQGFYSLTQSAGDALLAQRPRDARLESLYGIYFNTLGDRKSSLEWFGKALEDSPQKQAILFQIGTMYIQTGDANSALPYFKKAFDEEPSYPDARIYYAAALYATGQDKAGDNLLNEGFGTTLVDDDKVLQIYTNIKRWDRVIGIWTHRVAANENDAQTHVGLASAYFQSGQNTKAIEELQKAAQLNAALAPQIKQVIEQIQNGTLKPQ